MKVLRKAGEWIVVAMMAVVVGAVMVEVAIRDLFDLSIGVHEELTRYTMIWVAMLGAVLLMQDNGHIRISLLPDALPPRAAAAVGVLADIVVLFFLVGFVYACAMNLPRIVGQSTITLGVGMVWFHAALPVGGALMAVLALRNLIVHARQAMAGERP